MMKKMISLVLAAALAALVLASCKSRPKAEKHSGVFYNVFDTVITVISYQESDEDFDRLLSYARRDSHSLTSTMTYITATLKSTI